MPLPVPLGPVRQHKSAVKLHTLLEVRGSIPCSVYVTSGAIPDMILLDQLRLEPGAFYLLDRGYYDFARLYRFTQSCSYFVTRAKHNAQFSRQLWRGADRSTGLRSDQKIRFTGPKASLRYPVPLRRVHFRDGQHDLVFLTNNFLLPGLTIAQLYRARWQVELFFRWIKQHLHIETFYGTSANAVRIQVWVALSVYLLVAIARRQLAPETSLYKILQMLNISIFEKTTIQQAFSNTNHFAADDDGAKQLQLFDL